MAVNTQKLEKFLRDLKGRTRAPSLTDKMQKVFNFVAKHMFEQGVRAVDDGGACCYRTRRGFVTLKCAIGCLMPDDMYVPEMEGEGVNTLIARYGSIFPNCHLMSSLLFDLQRLHDNSANWHTTPDMRAALGYVADKHHLNMTAVRRMSFQRETQDA